MKRLLLLGMMSCAGWAQVPTQTPHPAAVKTGFTVKRDVVFARGTKGDLLADIYLPEKRQGKMPAVLQIHGGGWVNGTRGAMSPALEDMAAAGFVGEAGWRCTGCALMRRSTESIRRRLLLRGALRVESLPL